MLNIVMIRNWNAKGGNVAFGALNGSKYRFSGPILLRRCAL